jgi:hypothetical protein
MTLRSCCVPFIAIFVLSLSVACSGQIGVVPKGEIQLKAVADPRYHVGDVWEYRTRRGEEQSRFTVVKAESSPNVGTIVHIGTENLIWKTCRGDVLKQQIPHMPFALKALDASAIRRVGGSRKLPDYKEGYEEWRQAFLKGHAGVYTIPVQDAISVAEETWRSGLGCGHNDY